MLLDEAEPRGLVWAPGAVDACANLHGQPPAGGRGTGCKGETELLSSVCAAGRGADAGRQYRARPGQTGSRLGAFPLRSTPPYWPAMGGAAGCPHPRIWRESNPCSARPNPIQYKYDRVAVFQSDKAYFVGAGVPQCAGMLGSFFELSLAPAERLVVAVLLLELANEMRRLGGGGTLLAVPSAKKDWRRLLEFKYGVKPPQEALSLIRAANVERIMSLPAMASAATPREQEAVAWNALPSLKDLDSILVGDRKSVAPAVASSLEAVARLAAVDGALVLDDHLRVLGFGARIAGYPDGFAEPPLFSGRPIERGEGRFRPMKRIDLGGTRHQSAARFVDMEHDAVALVASHDGPLTLLYWALRVQDPGGGPILANEATVAVLNAELLTD